MTVSIPAARAGAGKSAARSSGRSVIPRVRISREECARTVLSRRGRYRSERRVILASRASTSTRVVPSLIFARARGLANPSRARHCDDGGAKPSASCVIRDDARTRGSIFLGVEKNESAEAGRGRARRLFSTFIDTYYVDHNKFKLSRRAKIILLESARGGGSRLRAGLGAARLRSSFWMFMGTGS